MALIYSSLFLFLSIGSVCLAVPLPSNQGREGRNNTRKLQQVPPRPQLPLQPIPNFQRGDWLDLSLGMTSSHQHEDGLNLQLGLPGQHSGDGATSSAGPSSSRNRSSGLDSPNVDPRTFQRPRSPPSPRSNPPNLPYSSQQSSRGGDRERGQGQGQEQEQGGSSLEIPQDFEGVGSRRVTKAWRKGLPNPERDGLTLCTRLAEAMGRRGDPRRRGAYLLGFDHITMQDGMDMWQAKDDPPRLKQIYDGIMERRLNSIIERNRQAPQP